MKRYTLHNGDNREVLKTFDDNSIDSIVTDPPYELGFMGKKWDASGIAYDVDLWKECLRVLKPGGHLLAFGGTRTYHRMTVAIEDAGFEVRDCIMWLYGSGFPKSHDVSKALDKQAGAVREIIGIKSDHRYMSPRKNSPNHMDREKNKDGGHGIDNPASQLTAPATPLAQQWQGWGTALKPAHEPIVVARKPLQGTVADNVQAWGVGALNIDGCRVGTEDGGTHCNNRDEHGKCKGHFNGNRSTENPTRHRTESDSPIGRWPANIIFDEEAAQMLDEQSGQSKSVQSIRKKSGLSVGNGYTLNNFQMNQDNVGGHSDSGGASRFFYVAKASKAEREAGLEGMEVKPAGGMQGRQDGTLVGEPVRRANHHPTVKPIALMRYLVRMVTPRGGVVLDPFMGSGTTGCAAMLEKVQFIGIELNQEYLDIAERRIRHWLSTNMMKEE